MAQAMNILTGFSKRSSGSSKTYDIRKNLDAFLGDFLTMFQLPIIPVPIIAQEQIA